MAAKCKECNEIAVQVRTVKPKPGTRTYKYCEDCRRTRTILQLRVRHTGRILSEYLNKPVQFNEGTGWRCGYLLKLGPSRASIQPIGSIGKCPDIIAVSIADIKPETAPSIKMPTVEDFYRVNNVKPPLLVVAGRTAAVASAIAAGKTIHITTDDTAGAPPVPVAPLVAGEVEPWSPERAVELYQSGITKIVDIATVFGDRNKQNRIRRALKAAGLQ